ncbi:hypothetical protein Tco_0880786 [Tanacetum coccineum]
MITTDRNQALSNNRPLVSTYFPILLSLKNRLTSRLKTHTGGNAMGRINYFLGLSVDVGEPTESETMVQGATCSMDPTLYRRSLQGDSSILLLQLSRFYLNAFHNLPLYGMIRESPNLAALNRILRYVQVLGDLGMSFICVLHYLSVLVILKLDWAVCPSTHKVNLQVIVFIFSDNLLSCPLNDNTLFHALVPKLNTGVLLTLYKTAWLHNLSSTKHSLRLKFIFVRDMVTASQVRVLHVPLVSNMPIFSPRDCLPHCLKNFDPV